MFISIKDKLDNPSVLQLMAQSEYDYSIERAIERTKAYRDNDAQQLYGWYERENLQGVCGFIVHADKVEINKISVDESSRGRGIGSAMVRELWRRYGKVIEAETDDDAVGFYRRIGFTASAYERNGFPRRKCVLPAPKPLEQITDDERKQLFSVILLEKC